MIAISPSNADRGGTTLVQKLILFLFGIALIAGVETVLRVAGIGGEAKLFVREKSPDGIEYYVTNEALNKRLFFPVTGKASDFPRPQVPYARFPVKKGENTFRFFVVGASSSVGFPFSPNVAFAGFLREMLAAGSEGMKIEGINTSMTAISSYQVGRWVKEIVNHYDPDLVVVYTGHNEVYGVLGAGSSMSVGTHRWLTRLFLDVQGTALYSLVAHGMEKVMRPPAGGPKGQPLESLTRNREVRPDSEMHRAVEKNFRKNLLDMRYAARKKGVPIFFCTPVSNRSGCAPMISLHDQLFDVAADGREWERYLTYGDTSFRTGDWKRAATEYGRALEMDPTWGETHYRLGLLALEEGRIGDARKAFSKALLHDALHLRACDPLLDIVREVAGDRKDAGVRLVDTARRFDEESERGVTGTDLVFEHVHPNGKGHYLIASEIYREFLRTDAGGRFSPAGELPFDEASRRTGYTPVDRVFGDRFMILMHHRWPFDGTFRNENETRRLEKDLRLARADLDSVETAVLDANRSETTVLLLHHKIGLAYLEAKLPEKAAGRFELLARVLPELVEVRLLLAASLTQAGDIEGALASLRSALDDGFLDREAIEADTLLAALRADPRYTGLYDGGPR